MMFKYKILIILTIFLFVSCISDRDVIPPFKRHEGKWKGNISDDKEIVLILDREGYAKLYIDKKLINPKNNQKEIYYAIDYNREPIYLDIIFFDNKSESIVIRCIIDFLSENMMRLATDFNEQRPLKFEDKNTFILKKIY